MNNVSDIYKMHNLIQQLNYFRDKYYNESKSCISDQKYDELYDELLELENKTGTILTGSPTHNVGYEIRSELKETVHSHPMLSLDKTKDLIKLNKFKNNQKCILMHKLDGLTCLLTYKNGELYKAETRGDGYKGEDITHNAKVFKNIPLKINHKGIIEFEGEAIIKYNDYERINNNIQNEKKYKTPRNLVSGSVRQLDSKIAKERFIQFIVWKVPSGMENENSFIQRLIKAEQLGFEIVNFCKVDCNKTINEGIINNLKNIAETKRYPIDGLVITYDDISYGLTLGTTEHHPKHSIAYKFYDEEYESKLITIDWTMGKSGQLTPTAVFEPIEIDGTMVSRACLHNISVMTNKLGRPYVGQTVYVTKRNMIIPQIERAEKYIEQYIEQLVK